MTNRFAGEWVISFRSLVKFPCDWHSWNPFSTLSPYGNEVSGKAKKSQSFGSQSLKTVFVGNQCVFFPLFVWKLKYFLRSLNSSHSLNWVWAISIKNVLTAFDDVIENVLLKKFPYVLRDFKRVTSKSCEVTKQRMTLIRAKTCMPSNQLRIN